MESILQISTPQSATWVPWMLLLMLMIWITGVICNPLAVKETFSTLYSKAERRYTDPTRWINQVPEQLFRLLNISYMLYLLVWMYQPGEETVFSLKKMALAVGMVWLVINLRRALMWMVNEVFSVNKQMQTMYRHYQYIWTVICMALWLIALGVSNGMPVWIMNIMLIIVGLFYVATVLYKVCRNHLHDLLSALYIALYLISLDVLPMVGMVLGMRWIEMNNGLGII